MTTPTTPQPAPRVAYAVPVNTVRAIVSVLETAAFIGATTLGLMNNGADFRHAAIAAFIGFAMHGINHNAGGSPV